MVVEPRATIGIAASSIILRDGTGEVVVGHEVVSSAGQVDKVVRAGAVLVDAVVVDEVFVRPRHTDT